jgi:iron complex outermembrane receptor protein
VIRDPTNGNAIVTILNNYRNLARTFTRGFDLDVRHDKRTTFGRFRTRLLTTYVGTFKEDDVERAGANGGTNTIPRIKGSLVLEWDQGPWTVTPRVNYVHHYYQQLLDGSFFTEGNGVIQTGQYPLKVPSYRTYDLFVRYAVTPKLSFSGAVVNIDDTIPPYDPGFSTTYLYDFTQYDVRGRQFRLGVQYRFD